MAGHLADPAHRPLPFTDIRTVRFEQYQAELEELRRAGRDVAHVERLPDGWRVFHQPRGEDDEGSADGWPGPGIRPRRPGRA
jgi:hypothetical protein